MKNKTWTKAEVRRDFLKRRNQRKEETRKAAGSKAAEHLLYLEEVKKAPVVFLYASYQSEMPTKDIFYVLKKLGKTVAMPKTDGDRMRFYSIDSWEELVPGYKNIPEPDANGREPLVPCAEDVMILPGVAFDKEGNRLGYGAGYYDRYLEELGSRQPICVGLAYECQIVKETLPVEAHDRKVRYLVTEQNRWRL